MYFYKGTLLERVLLSQLLFTVSTFLVPVALVPNTASAWLSVSTDLDTTSACEEQQQTLTVPAKQERFVHPRAALGSEGFKAGRHSWEVRWVTTPAAPWEWSARTPATGSTAALWVVSLSDGQYCAFPSCGGGVLGRGLRPRWVKDQLDWEEV